jgi:5-methylcytosine-specific restriction endonuclease McrA
MLTPAHVISAANNGMGRKENLVTACIPCHDIFDHGTREERDAMYDKAVAYLKQFYPEWDAKDMIYSKYGI